MGFNAALRLHLVGDSAIAAQVGERVFPVGEDEANANNYDSGYPYITFQRISANRPFHLGGSTGLANPRLQVDVVGLTSAQTETVGELVRKRMNGFRGTMGSGSDTAIVRHCQLDDEQDDWDEREDASERSIFVRRQDYLMWHTEATS